jgi:phthalate 4,5-dioxygenase oxygenase subunit
MRQYWIPAIKSSELARDGAPMRLMLLGERLIAIRDSDGRVGVMDHRCPHRGTSLFLGRNEQGGVRCIYHGWKFDVAGRCLDMPNLVSDRDLRPAVRAKAYPVVERNGLIWVYMGPRAEPPPMPLIEATLVPEDQLDISMIMRDCNWMQALEGDIDTSHFGFLHVGDVDADDVPEDHSLYHYVTNRSPDFEVGEMPWGTTCGAFRANLQAGTYWRFSNYLFPFWTQQPAGKFAIHVHARAWVPLDDTHTMFIYILWKGGASFVGSKPLKSGRIVSAGQRSSEYLPNTTDWHGRWRLKANESNDWMMNRDLQRSGESYSGIESVHLQDQAVTESMGPIVDHGLEHLMPSDRMIVRTRRRVLNAAREFRDHGKVPPGVDDPAVFFDARSGFFVAPERPDWRLSYYEQLRGADRPVTVAADPP